MSHNAKKLKGGPQNSKKIEGGPFGEKYFFEKKSRTMPKKLKDPLVSPGIVC